MEFLAIDEARRAQIAQLTSSRYIVTTDAVKMMTTADELDDFLTRLESLDSAEVYALQFVIDYGYTVAESLRIVETEQYRIHDGNMTDVARQYVSDCYGEDLRDLIEKQAGSLWYYVNIDYEMLGRDMRIEGNYYECSDRGEVLEIID